MADASNEPRADEELPRALWDRLTKARGLIIELTADRARAPVLLAELLSEPPAVRKRMAVSLDRFRSPALAELAALHLATADRGRALAALLAAASALGEGAECFIYGALGGVAEHER